MAFQIRQISEDVIAAQTFVDAGVDEDVPPWRLRAGGVGLALVRLGVVDLQVADRVGRVVAVGTHKPLQHVVGFLVPLQVTSLRGFVRTSEMSK